MSSLVRVMRDCLRLCKDTKIKANHNIITAHIWALATV